MQAVGIEYMIENGREEELKEKGLTLESICRYLNLESKQ